MDAQLVIWRWAMMKGGSGTNGLNAAARNQFDMSPCFALRESDI